MSKVVISVSGKSSRKLPPEHAVVHVTVSSDGPERSSVLAQVAALSEPLRAELEAAVTTGTVTAWTAERARIWSDRPWNDQGKQLPLVHHAQVPFTATYVDVAALSDWLNDIAQRDGISIGDITWDLTPDTRARVEREVATEAIGVAVERASAYAAALGLGTVTPTEVGDVGLTGDGGAKHARAAMFAHSATEDSVGPGLDFQPGQITVNAAVEARFTAE